MNRPGLPPARRWAISFADLALLIACTLLLGWRPEGGMSAAEATPQRTERIAISDLFVANEAVLSQVGDRRLAAFARSVSQNARIRIAVGVGHGRSSRLDAWELAAARTAAVGRRLPDNVEVDLAAPQRGNAVVMLTRL
jgi:hypothetical protein